MSSDPVTTTEKTDLVPRNSNGQLKPGAKLGRGRRKGSKNKSTILREAMQEKTSIRLSKQTPKVLQVVLDAAKAGDLQAAKMILDRTIPIRKASEGEDNANTSVHITISNLTRENVAESLQGVTLEGELEEESNGP